MVLHIQWSYIFCCLLISLPANRMVSIRKFCYVNGFCVVNYLSLTPTPQPPPQKKRKKPTPKKYNICSDCLPCDNKCCFFYPRYVLFMVKFSLQVRHQTQTLYCPFVCRLTYQQDRLKNPLIFLLKGLQVLLLVLVIFLVQASPIPPPSSSSFRPRDRHLGKRKDLDSKFPALFVVMNSYHIF